MPQFSLQVATVTEEAVVELAMMEMMETMDRLFMEMEAEEQLHQQTWLACFGKPWRVRMEH
tara:strand:- start:165 stop:347 length:183 start_codon:yes stop_codon:yes gene_type:complete